MSPQRPPTRPSHISLIVRSVGRPALAGVVAVCLRKFSLKADKLSKPRRRTNNRLSVVSPMLKHRSSFMVDAPLVAGLDSQHTQRGRESIVADSSFFRGII